MNELDTRAERFLESIRAEGEAACAAIRTETDAEIDRQLDEARQAQQAKAEHTLHFETERARTRANRELSAARMQARAKLAAQRQQIAADAFAAARTQLATFAASNAGAVACAARAIGLAFGPAGCPGVAGPTFCTGSAPVICGTVVCLPFNILARIGLGCALMTRSIVGFICPDCVAT